MSSVIPSGHYSCLFDFDHLGYKLTYHLTDFVPGDRRSEEIPCHFIPLNESGDTLEQLESEDDQQKLEAALKDWLRTKIKEIEAARLATTEPTQVS